MLVGPRCWLISALLASAVGAAETRQLTLGLVAPSNDPYSASLLHGAQAAVAEAETSGFSVALEVRGGTGQWGTVGNDAVILVSDRHVDAIIAPSDGAACHLILQVSGRTRVPVASVCPDSSVTEAGVPWAVRVVPRTDQQAEALFAAVAPPGRPPPVWWAIIPENRPGRAVRRDLETAARVSATRLDRILEGGEQTTDLSPVVNQVVAAAPGGVLIWLPPAPAGKLVAALRAAGYGGRLAGSSSLDAPEFFAAAGAAAAGVLVTEFRSDAELRGRADRFEKRYRKSYGARPDFSAMAAYDATRVLIEILSRAGDRSTYHQNSLALPTSGVTGSLHFDNFGNRTDPLQVQVCQQGKFIPALLNQISP